MSERRRTRSTGGQIKAQRVATQTNLKDLFHRKNSSAGSTVKVQDLPLKYADPANPPQTADPHPPPHPPRRPKPSRLFPIFTKVPLPPNGLRETVTSVDDTEVIDITDDSSDIDMSTGPRLSSAHPPSPCSEYSHATLHSPPPSPTTPNIHCCEGIASFPHVGTHEDTYPYKTGKVKVPGKRMLGLRDVAPFPSSCSQHVRGVQHSYTAGQAPVKRNAPSGYCPSNEGTLDFIKKLQQTDNIPSIPLGHIHRSLTPQESEQYIQSFGRGYVDSHPAFARIAAHQERVLLSRAETWTRRFRPRRANEVLGNEQHAIYLRDWLRALELRLRDRQPEGPVPKGIAASETKKGALKRVELRGMKRPRVTRAVTRKRGHKKRRVDPDDDLDDFVVYSDVDEEQTEGPPEDSEDEFAFCKRTLTRLHGVVSNIPATEINHGTSRLQELPQTNFAANLTNTLLITGPPGCGKTAAVYACAEELGWKVFEVYPGIGRRNGANLDHLIGDVGRNHIVQTVHKHAPTEATELEAKELVGLRGCLTRNKTGRSGGFGKTQEGGTEGQPISVEAGSSTHEMPSLLADQAQVSSDEAAIREMCGGESDGSRSMIGQSLVLLEEVDILFKEDAGFWPAVIEFIQCCQRPVVMTCNDLGLVPVGELPIQKVLVFEPCPSTVAATFLQCLSLTEGCLVPHEDLMALYETTHWIDEVDVPDGPLYPRTEPLPVPDLRRSITQLQMLCAGARHGSTLEMHQGEEAEGHARRSGRPISVECRVMRMGGAAEEEWWREMRRQSELMSHVDAQLCRPPMATREVLGMSGGGTEETGYVVLSTEGWGGEGREGLAYCERDELIAEEAIRHSRGLHGEFATGPNGPSINPAARLTREGFRARVEYQSRMVEALEGVLSPAAPLMPQRSVFLDYIPWVGRMVAVDDVLEGRAGRRTRNSMGTRHVRGVVLSEGQRAVVRGSRFVEEEEEEDVHNHSG